MDKQQRATELFLACCDMPPAEREAFLAERCGRDQDLIEQVKGMIAFEKRRPGFLAASAVEDVIGQAADRLPETIGPYRILRKLGEGGMGAVYEAEQAHPHRTVALKVLRPLFVSPDALRRFEHEGEFLARLQHPGIAQIFGSGTAETERGSEPYFALELVRGESLTEHARRQSLSARERLELLARVADAVQHAHQHGVIHRDLKPANILVDPSGQPKVLDFGIARASDPEAQLATLQTGAGQILGTLAYMSPEQASGHQDAVDTRSDVYSLGVLLYELLADRLPYDVSQKSLPEAVRIIQEEVPARLGAIDSTHRGDLETIARKALEKEKERRYSSAAALAEDLRHYLRHEPIAARPPSRSYTLAKLVERNKALAGSMVAGILALVAGVVASSILAARASEAAAREGKRADEVLSLSAFQRLQDLRLEADRLWPPSPENLERYDDWIARARELLAGLEPGPDGDDVGHRARLVALERRALPYTEERRAAERLSHPRFAELEKLRATCAVFERGRAVRAGEAEPEVVVLDQDSLPSSAVRLLELALPLVDLQRTSFGEEARGLALARLALERVEDEVTLVRANTTFAQALFAVGRPEEALAEMATTAAQSPATLLQEVQVLQTRMKGWFEAGLGPGGAAETARLQDDLVALEAEVSRRREWRFESVDDRWWFNQLRELVGELESFEASLVAEDAVTPEHGWSVGKRIAVAREAEAGFAEGGRYSRAWNEALDSGLQLPLQQGLVPLGRDPDSGLWEFGHPATGTLPERGEGGRLIPTEASCLVFVLLPGDTFRMGAQSMDPARPNYDPLAEPGVEGPTHEVTLPPFFLSKYEMTQGQWLRITQRTPSYYSPGTNSGGIVTSLLHPVENVNWSACWLVLGRLGLTLPSEAQWEYGTRAGTTGPWWTGEDRSSLEGAANVADQYCLMNGGAAWGRDFMPWDDGHVVHAPVGSFAPNGFGLHDVHGNVWEWCVDAYATDRRNPSFFFRDLDPLAPVEDGPLRPYRGGSFGMTGDLARCTKRGVDPPTRADLFLGVRPARSITGELR